MVDAGYSKDVSMWPLVIWRMNRVLTVAEFNEYLRDLESVLIRRERFAQVVVARLEGGHSALTADTRKIQTQWIKRHFRELEEHCAGMAIVVHDMSPVVHFTLSVVMSVLGRPPTPSKILPDEAEALQWARAQVVRSARTA